ncbi:NFX1-type zinc finger-containing protein 1-like [Ruditapes philippinarum]|uniref:NFX1-type zinc finger-containing protein 1-like n=1 Tax=Ruditapes philippinarum TaxID=129788 RepID=UPI00295BC925|nr:NFX1-type zinc finger-containing protein 1-like [Ruditapes philippinarum]
MEPVKPRTYLRPTGKSREKWRGRQNIEERKSYVEEVNNANGNEDKQDESDRGRQDWSSKGARPKSVNAKKFQSEKSPAFASNRRNSHSAHRPHSAVLRNEKTNRIGGEDQYTCKRQENDRFPKRFHSITNANKDNFDIRRTGSESQLNFNYRDKTDEVSGRRYNGRVSTAESQIQSKRNNYNADRKDKEVHTGRKIVLGFPFLKNLIGNDPGYIVLELTKNKTALKECLKRTSENQEFLEVFLQALSKAYLCRTTPGLMIELFETLKDASFFDSVVFLLIDILGKGLKLESTTEQMIKNIIQIITIQLTRNPSSLFVVSRACTLLGQIIDGMSKETFANKEIVSMFQDLAGQKETLEKEQKTSSGLKSSRKPPDDYRQYSVAPSISEITSSDRPFLRQNKVEGEYDDLDHYLDVQFRLLREDFVGPLREGITEYIKIKTIKQDGNDNKSIRKLDIKIYENVSVYTPVITEYGLCYKMQLEMTNFIRRVNWSVSRRLMYGSLVCLTDNEFNTFYLATVVGRDEMDITNGYFIVHFEEDVSVHDVLHKVFQMAETSAYFESYRHVLSSLQTIREGDLPFEKYIVHCNRNIDPPLYLKSVKTLDLRPLIDQHITLHSENRLQNIGTQIRAGVSHQFTAKSFKAKSVNVLDKNSWPSKELLHLDESQYEAVQTALTSEFSIIQGPPGTGKTYIGLKIVKALLHNRSTWLGSENQLRPMLVVCFTNHALDQFLEGIAAFFKGDILRVGGRSESETLRKFNLKHYRQFHQSVKSHLGKLQMSKKQAKQELEEQSEKLEETAITIELYRSEVIGENHLREQMGIMLYNSLINNYRGNIYGKHFSYIKKWLGIKHIEGIAWQQAEQAFVRKEDNYVNIEDNTKQRQKHMITDFDNEDGYSMKQKESFQLKQIRHRIGIVYYVKDKMETEQKTTDEERKHTLFKRFLKVLVMRKISDVDVMSEEEAERINDVWRLDHNTKWRLYRLWVQKLCLSKYDEIEARRAQFELASERYREAMMQEDREIMSKASVIGMTTSCAARYQAVLRDISPRIVIVEEAAEVLEAHIVTTLSKSCEHLILIGDHKQLRPNPNVYRLAIRYKLDVSLFERMIKNNMTFNCLKLQHRMRPSISSLVKHIYPDLSDHSSVTSYPDIKGVSANLFLVDHENEEKTDDDIRSYSNVYEAQYVAELCRYLLLQGYERHEITILTTYTGQLMCIRKCMPKDQFNGVKVTVVDNYQGEENKIIILSLVRSNKNEKIGFLKTENRICVALSRAKYGFYILGNFSHLATHSTLWKEITEEMKTKGWIENGLKLYCQNHPRDDAIIAVKPDDFRKAPEGGCQKYCDIRLKCGHVCKRYCHVLDRQHETNQCKEPCTRVLCELGHKCPQKCFDKCRPCTVPLQKFIPKCGHQQTIPCSVEPEKYKCKAPCETKLECGHQCANECGKLHTKHCQVKIDISFPCGHNASICCADKKTAKCQHSCGAILKCEHICNGTCSTCFMGKVHQPCHHKCNRILVCGHACNDFCKHCPPCKAHCENRCVHSKCDKSCGEPCIPCKEICSWNCKHFTCTKLCSEPCNRPKCNKACNKRLKCKHSCIGFCGEPCPTLCKVCDKEKVTEIIFGNEDHKNARFVLLEDCMHVIESRALDKYMHMRDKANPIQLKGCPICKTTIRKCLRYGNLINQILEDIERVKGQMIGDTGIIDRVSHQILRNPIISGNVVDRHRLGNVRIPAIRSMKEKISNAYSERIQSAFEARLKILMNGNFYTETQLLSVENQHRLVKAAVDIRYRFKTNIEKTTVDERHLLTLEGLGITEVERLQIIKAVGLPKGHWFKCPKNHIYAIGECGGASQRSTCPECKSDIGGMSNKLADGNKLAPEMDGAAFAAYSEEANNMGNFDLNNLH